MRSERADSQAQAAREVDRQARKHMPAFEMLDLWPFDRSAEWRLEKVRLLPIPH
jgi:hypothetical protein